MVHSHYINTAPPRLNTSSIYPTNLGTSSSVQPSNLGTRSSVQTSNLGTSSSVQPSNLGTRSSVQPSNLGTKSSVQPTKHGPSVLCRAYQTRSKGPLYSLPNTVQGSSVDVVLCPLLCRCGSVETETNILFECSRSSHLRSSLEVRPLDLPMLFDQDP